MDTILLKYHSSGRDYLIYDACKNDIVLNQKAVLAICERNFGVGSAGILAGAVLPDGELQLKLYLPDGREAKIGNEEIGIYVFYLKQAGYLGRRSLWLHTVEGMRALEETASKEHGAEEIGKLFLTEKYIQRNRLSRRRKVCCL
ncbi:MAG: hypothetical protein PHE06_08050 [Lachnospiraceae bacterium]|nr:hypothetical protein [Lachnospiraceae bacterium]MDD3795904.1 hypothetical protein [Lachnospiraceae bacterium]